MTCMFKVKLMHIGPFASIFSGSELSIVIFDHLFFDNFTSYFFVNGIFAHELMKILYFNT